MRGHGMLERWKSKIEEEVRKNRGLLNLLCDAGDEQQDENMDEYAGDISAVIEDLQSWLAEFVDADAVQAEFLKAADKLTGRPVSSYFKQV